MSTLLDGLDEMLSDQRAKNLRDYAAIIARHAEENPGDKKRALDLLEAMGTHPDQLAQELRDDVAAFDRARDAECGIVPANELARLREASTQATIAREAARKAWEAKDKDLSNIEFSASMASRNAKDETRQAKDAIATAKSSRPRAFGVMPAGEGGRTGWAVAVAAATHLWPARTLARVDGVDSSLVPPASDDH